MSSVRSTIGCPPSSATPASNEVRVRVEGAWKTSATVRPVQRVRAQRRGLELGGAIQQPPELGGRQFLPGQQVSRQARQCTLGAMRLRVLTWNLFHGRSVPGRAGLFDEFAAALASWEWDVALLQEVPPWWPRRLAAAPEAASRRRC